MPLFRSGRIWLVWSLIGLVFLLIGAPLFGLLLGAFTDTPPGVAPRFSLDALAYAYGAAQHLQSLGNSLAFAFCTATLVLLLGGALAWAAARTDSLLRHFGDVFVLVPIFIPAVLFVAGWILLLGPSNGLVNLFLVAGLNLSGSPFDIYSFSGMVWVAVLQELPLAFLWLWPTFRAMNPSLEEAAMVAGASTGMIIRRISLPLLRPTLLSAWIIFFIYSLGALAVPLMIGLPSRIILYSTEVYLAAHRVPGDLNLASAFSLLFLAVTVAGVFLYRRMTSDADRFVTITGKAFSPRIVRLGRWRALVDLLAVATLFLTAGLPIMVLVWNAFLPFPQAPSRQAFDLLTLKNFSDALSYGPAIRAVVNSLWIGLAAGVVTTLLGAAIAWTVVRYQRPRLALALLDQMATLTIATPGMIVGVSLLWFYLLVPLPIYGTPWLLLIAYITLHLPYAVRICVSGLSQLHKELEEAGWIAGAGWSRIALRIVLPLIGASLLTSVLYVTLRAFREYAASIFLAGPGTEVFSVLVLDLWDGGQFNLLSAYVTLVVAVLAAVVAVFSWLTRRFSLKLASSK